MKLLASKARILSGSQLEKPARGHVLLKQACESLQGRPEDVFIASHPAPCRCSNLRLNPLPSEVIGTDHPNTALPQFGPEDLGNHGAI